MTDSTKFPNGTILTRQTVGNIGWGKWNPPDLNTPFDSFDRLMRGSYGSYRYGGLTFCPTILTGQYAAFAFVARAGNSFQFNFNPTYGWSALISVSSAPGDFSGAVPYVAAHGNSLNTLCAPGTHYPNWATLTDEQTYYFNFAGVTANGDPSCAFGLDGKQPATCASVTAAYYT